MIRTVEKEIQSVVQKKMELKIKKIKNMEVDKEIMIQTRVQKVLKILMREARVMKREVLIIKNKRDRIKKEVLEERKQEEAKMREARVLEGPILIQLQIKM